MFPSLLAKKQGHAAGNVVFVLVTYLIWTHHRHNKNYSNTTRNVSNKKKGKKISFHAISIFLIGCIKKIRVKWSPKIRNKYC